MGLSRRMFTKEFKLAAVQRLERGSSIGEVARALEVNPNVLHRWRREIRQGPGNVFPGHGKQRWAEGRIAELERKIGQQALGYAGLYKVFQVFYEDGAAEGTTHKDDVFCGEGGAAQQHTGQAQGSKKTKHGPLKRPLNLGRFAGPLRLGRFDHLQA